MTERRGQICVGARGACRLIHRAMLATDGASYTARSLQVAKASSTVGVTDRRSTTRIRVIQDPR
jgi:hypothetical protein